MLNFALLFVGIIFYTYFGYIVVLLFLSVFIQKKVRKSEDYLPTTALVIAAYNEEKGIDAKIINSLDLNYPKDKLRIIVVSDGSTDGTDAIVDSYSNAGVELIRVEGRVGKTEARNQALKQIDSEIIVFSDATTVYEADSINMLVRNFNDPKVGMVTGHLKYIDPENSQVGVGQKLYWKYETLIKKAQTNLGTLTGSIGCMTAFRRSAYTDLPSNIIEDFTSPLMFIQKGFRVVYEASAICFEETTTKASSEWHMRVRVIRGGMSGLLFARNILSPFQFPLVSLQLISHKVFRWFVPVFGILTLIFNVLALISNPSDSISQTLFILQVLFYGSALTSYHFEQKGIKNKVLSIPLYFIVLNSASLVALYKTLTSTLESTWETQR